MAEYQSTREKVFGNSALPAPWNVYLAGKIGVSHNWRDEVLSSSMYDLRVVNEWHDEDPVSFPITKGAIRGGHNYTGPYWVGDGQEHDWYGSGEHAQASGYARERNKFFIVEECRRAIFGSDLVFAWIEHEGVVADATFGNPVPYYTGYGTLIELGVASTSGARVVIGTPSVKDLHRELWFAALTARGRVFEAESAGDAWDMVLRKYTLVVDLKTMPYDQYLQTDHWKQTTTAAKARAGHRCQLCNCYSTTLHTHHRTYERRGEERHDDLIVLCATCHELFHKNGKLAKA